MPIKLPSNATSYARRALESRLWDVGAAASPGMGCHSCVDRHVCGMLHLEAGFLDCSEFCCGAPETCTSRICRLAPKEFVRRHMEIQGFTLDNVAAAPVLAVAQFPRSVPMIYHGNRRENRFETEAASIKLSRLYDPRNGTPRFATRAALMEYFRLSEQSRLVACGIDHDRFVEGWWGLSLSGRARIIENLKVLGVELVTVPNFSVSVNWPRASDLYSMKRIALTWQEFVAAGIPAALHPNGRTEHDFLRWRAFVAARPEVTHIAYDFTTGTKRPGRRDLHAGELARLAREAGRPLHLMVMGGREIWPTLASAFETVTVLETSIFMKTMHRQRAFNRGNSDIGYDTTRTAKGVPLDNLLIENNARIGSAVALRTARSVERNP